MLWEYSFGSRSSSKNWKDCGPFLKIGKAAYSLFETLRDITRPLSACQFLNQQGGLFFGLATSKLCSLEFEEITLYTNYFENEILVLHLT